MPGFLAGDQTLSVIAAWLRRLGYRPQFCGFVLNAGCSDRTLDRVERRVDTLWRSHGRRVALIGHSRGGHFARALAARRPYRVSHAISVGADLQGLFGASTPTLAAVDLARRVVHASGRARNDACLSRHCGCRFSHDFARPFPFEQVRLTSIYSKGDGVVHWQCQVIPDADCVEVTGPTSGSSSTARCTTRWRAHWRCPSCPQATFTTTLGRDVRSALPFRVCERPRRRCWHPSVASVSGRIRTHDLHQRETTCVWLLVPGEGIASEAAPSARS